MSFTALDIVLLLCFIPALIRGAKKGFIDQLIGIATLLIGSFLSFRLSRSVSLSLAPTFPNVDIKILGILSFVLIFAIVSILLWMLGRLIEKALRATSLGWFNRLLGVLFSLVITCILLGILISLFEPLNARFSFVEPGSLDSSAVYRMIRRFSQQVLPYFQDYFGK